MLTGEEEIGRRREKGERRQEKKGDADWRPRKMTEEGERWEKEGEGRH
jgi:hypothetical protein